MNNILRILLFAFTGCSPAYAQITITAPVYDTVYSFTPKETKAIANGIRKLQAKVSNFDSLLSLQFKQAANYEAKDVASEKIILLQERQLLLSRKNDSLYREELKRKDEEIKDAQPNFFERYFLHNPLVGILAGIAVGIFIAK